MAYNIGPRISVQGEKEFNDSIKRIDQSFKTLSSEMRVVESQFTKNANSTEALNAKKQVLSKQIDNQKSRLAELSSQYQKQSQTLESLEKAVEDASDAYGENSKEADKARSAYEKQQSILSQLQTGINNTTANLNGMEQQLKDTNKELSEMTAKHLKDASKSVKEFGESAEKAGKKMMPATLAIAGAGAAAFKMAADAEDAAGATDQIFGRSADAMREWAKNLETYYGIAASEALEYGNMMGTMLQNIGGLTEQQAAKQAQTLIKLAGDLSAMYGGSTADAVRALTGALKGNNTMLDNYGMAVNEAMVKTKAMEMGLASQGKEMTLAAKQAATLALIMEQTGAAQGQAAREADGASGSMKAAQAAIKNLAESFGTVLLPAITPLIQQVTAVIDGFSKMDEGTKKLVVGILAVVAAVGPILIIIGKMSLGVSALLGLGAKLTPILFGTAAANTAVAGSAAAAATSAGLLSGALALLTSPVTLVIAAIATLIFIIGDLGDEIQSVLGKANDFMQNIFARDWSKTFGGLGDLMNAFSANFKNIWDAILKVLNGVIDLIRGAFTGDWERAWSGVIGIFSGLFDGLAAIVKAPLNGIIGMINGLISGVNLLIKGLNKIKIDIPKWVPQIGGNTFGINIPEIGKIPMLATGGYLHQGSAIVGEAGAELLTMMGNKAKVTPLTGGAKAAAVTGGDTFYVTIDAKNVTDFNRVVQMANAARQQGRAF